MQPCYPIYHSGRVTGVFAVALRAISPVLLLVLVACASAPVAEDNAVPNGGRTTATEALETCHLPNVVGLEVTAARQIIEALGLELVVQSQDEDEPTQTGMVLEQEPDYNTRLAPCAGRVTVVIGAPTEPAAAERPTMRTAQLTRTTALSQTTAQSPGTIPTIEWGAFGDYFAVSHVHREQQEVLNEITGEMMVIDVLAFEVEATSALPVAVFLAHFYDAQENEIDIPALIVFETEPVTWDVGHRDQASIILPAHPSSVATIKIVQT
ncbi:MAG: PASTA domain-containing protein [Chloroflexaceae bacterium]|nr:PASTA domain-containing protein [Chloroflexaceae bacterium]